MSLAFPAIGTRRNDRVFTFWMKWLCYSCLSVFATAKSFLSMWLVLQKLLEAVPVFCGAIPLKPNYALLSFSASIVSTLFWEHWAGVGFRGGERETVTSVPSYVCHSGHPLRVSHLVFTYFFTRRPIFKMTKQISQFGHNARNHRLVNTVSASFNAITRYMTECSKWKIQVFALLCLKNSRTLEPLLTRYEVSHMLFKIKQQLAFVQMFRSGPLNNWLGHPSESLTQASKF